MPKFRPAQPQSFGSAQSYEIFDDEDEVEPEVPEDDDDLPMWSCSGCRAGHHGNSSSHTKQPGCRLYQELPKEKPTPEAEKIEKLRRMREQMFPELHAASPGSTGGRGSVSTTRHRPLQRSRLLHRRSSHPTHNATCFEKSCEVCFERSCATLCGKKFE